ncbi:MAG: phosphoglucosamine mutase [Candidatus Caccovivens sp.]
MANYFGTDGIRGEYGKNLTTSLAFAVGNALTQTKCKPNVIIGHDTRVSADALCLALCAGIVQGGGSVTNVGCIPTAGISFLTESENFDYGIMITASHNPPNYNGIKIFDKTGQKLSENEEEFLEEFLKNNYICDRCGKYKEDEQLKNKYVNHLLCSLSCSLEGLKICLDASNGASYKIAPKVFKSTGAQVLKYACNGNGEKINQNCGSLHIENLQKQVEKNNADLGFAFDGDADRVIAVSKSGEVFDGDKLLYILAVYMKQQGLLYANSVVGTSHTNSGIMVALNRHKINLIRTDIGDKYVIDAMKKMNLSLGGEQSGHIIIKTYAQTGDGILTALKICEIIKKTGKSLEELFDAKLIPQSNLNLVVRDKFKVMNNENLKNLITEIVNRIAPAGRVMVRASGTEEKIRIMVEHPEIEMAKQFSNQIKDNIENI